MTPLGISSGHFGMSYAHPGSAAVDSAVDAFATKFLRQSSPPDVCIDENLGPYITSLMRCCMSTERVEELPDFEALIELLEEHCALNHAEALNVLATIAKAVRSGIMGEELCLSSYFGETQPPGDNQSRFSFTIEGFPERQPDMLIPVDLMGLIDDPSTPVTKHRTDNFEYLESEPDAFPPLGTSVQKSTASKKNKTASQKSKEEMLNSCARSTHLHDYYPLPSQHSIVADDLNFSTIQGSASDGITYQNDEYDMYHQQLLDSNVDMLLSMNSDLAHDAAYQAVLLACLDVNIAQLVIDRALSAPPVCRHKMGGGCYRSDCQFSHDVDGHTCLFWMRGRCGKGKACKFRHGFSDVLLDGCGTELTKVDESDLVQSHFEPGGIPTTNLLHKNESGFSVLPSDYWEPPPALSKQSLGHLEKGVCFTSVGDPQRKGGSFASIASKGYKTDSFSISSLSPGQVSTRTETVKIPQDLWSHYMNRNTSAFQILDPIERYKEVSKSVRRDDVIDLHFQSMKTFPTVLSSVLNQKLREHQEVWVVTGTGHHVARDSHQKGGGALEMAVMTWLDQRGFSYVRGRDRNGHGGAVLIKGR